MITIRSVSCGQGGPGQDDIIITVQYRWRVDTEIFSTRSLNYNNPVDNRLPLAPFDHHEL